MATSLSGMVIHVHVYVCVLHMYMSLHVRFICNYKWRLAMEVLVDDSLVPRE